MVAQDRAEHVRPERPDGHHRRLAPVERLLVVAEDLREERAHAAADDEVDPRPALVPAPGVLHLAEHGGVHAPEVLELVDEERDWSRLRGFEDGLEDRCEAQGSARSDGDPELGLHLGRERFAQVGLGLARDIEVDVGLVAERRLDEGGLSDATPARDDRPLRRRAGAFADVPQLLDFVLPVIELHGFSPKRKQPLPQPPFSFK